MEINNEFKLSSKEIIIMTTTITPKTRIIQCLAFVVFVHLAMSVSAQIAGPYTTIVTEAEIIAVTGQTDYDAGALAVNSSGTIYCVDLDGTDRILRITPGSPNVVEVMADNDDIIAAAELVNGTTSMTAFNPRGIAVDSDGDIIVVGFTNVNNGDTIVSLTDTVPATITVLQTSVDGADSGIPGSSSLTVVGTTAYVGLDDSFGVADDLVTLDTNASGPSATVTTLVTQATLEALPGQVASEVAFNSLSNDGSDVFGTLSDAAESTQDVARITSAGVVTIVASGADITAALQLLDGTVTDNGSGAIAVDGEGDIWVSNSFGDGIFEDGILQITSSGVDAAPATLISNQLGLGAGNTPFLGNDGFAYDAANDRILFNQGEDGDTFDGEGIVAVTASAPLFTGATTWNSFD
jgi:hypothetical protein